MTIGRRNVCLSCHKVFTHYIYVAFNLPVCSIVWTVFSSGLYMLQQCCAFDALKLFTPSNNCFNFDTTFRYTLLTNILLSSVHYTISTQMIFSRLPICTKLWFQKLFDQYSAFTTVLYHCIFNVFFSAWLP